MTLMGNVSGATVGVFFTVSVNDTICMIIFPIECLVDTFVKKDHSTECQNAVDVS